MNKNKVIRSTKILCNNCEEECYLVVVPGSETKEALVCPTCGNYHYFVGHIYCCGSKGYPVKDWGVLREALGGSEGDFSLKPEVAHRILEMRKRLGLNG